MANTRKDPDRISPPPYRGNDERTLGQEKRVFQKKEKCKMPLSSELTLNETIATLVDLLYS